MHYTTFMPKKQAFIGMDEPLVFSRNVSGHPYQFLKFTRFRSFRPPQPVYLNQNAVMRVITADLTFLVIFFLFPLTVR